MKQPVSYRRPVAAINVTPLVDVLLILLVVLLLAMPMFVKKLPVDLPSTSLAGTPTPVQSLRVAVFADGRLTANDTPVSLEDLAARVTTTSTVELSIDKTVTYDRLAQTVAAVQAKNPKEIVMLTR